MDLDLTDDDLRLRAEVRAFIAEQLPPGVQRKVQLGLSLARNELVDWQQRLHARGWATPHWPVAWGGPGWTPMQRHIFMDELHQAAAPEPLSFNVTMVGPVLIAFGTPEQQQRHLPRIARLDDWWCQGFSEPDAGSDLAALTTSAQREGDVYVVNGQKTWTTLAQHADWMFALVRTDPGAQRHRGISFLLIDMCTPGISVRPIITLDGRHEVNEVFFDNVRVPAANLVGQENRGWDCARFLLTNERTGQARVGMVKERLSQARRLAAHTTPGRPAPIDDARVQEQLAWIDIEAKALEVTLLRVLSEQEGAQGRQFVSAASLLKVRGSELRQRTTQLLMDLAGTHALRGSVCEAPAAAFERDMDAIDSLVRFTGTTSTTYAFLRALSIFGGATGIQKNLIAKTLLET